MKVLNAKDNDNEPVAEAMPAVEPPEGGDAGNPDNPDSPGKSDKPVDTEFTKAVRKSIEAVREQIASDPASAVDPDDPLPGVPKTADVDANVKEDPVLNAAAGEADPGFHSDARLAEKELAAAAAEILPAHKRAFTESLITGERYTEDFSLLGGRMSVRIRSRSSAETEAITAYARRMVVTGKVRTDYDYSALMRKILAVAQVDEINGVKQPRMEEPLFFTETREELVPPGWEPRIKAWGDKPEAILAAVVRCVLEFEARYWEMIRKVNDTDFWVPAGPTGE